MSSLLTIFIQQNCGGYTCSIKENFEELSDLNITAVVFNFFTFGCLFTMYVFIYYREDILIKLLDENPILPKTWIKNVFQTYPQIKEQVYKWDDILFYTAIVNSFIYLVNVILSTIIIIEFYDGWLSIFYLVVNSGLCVSILYRCINNSMSTRKENVVLSLIQNVPVCFNDVDKLVNENNILEMV